MDTKKIFETLIELCINKNYSDLHLNSSHKAFIRNHYGDLEIIDLISIDWNEYKISVFKKDDIIEIIKIISWDLWLSKFLETFEMDLSYKYKDSVRFRVNFYSDANWFSIAMRKIPINIPTMDELFLWETIKQMCQKSKWLILVTWPTWSWKSTNLAAMLDYINTNFKKHIITIEDPVEFEIVSKKSLVNQREIWNSTKSFENAIRATLREDPNVIMVWEMRDPETIKAAITLAETGHLVFSTLHTNDTVQTIDRIVDVFPNWQQEQIRMQLAMSLIWIISQRLLPRIDKEWRIPAREILVNNDAIRNLTILWKTHQLYSVLEVWHKEWMVLIDKYLLVLYNKWIISLDVLKNNARDKDSMDLID